LHSTGTDVSSCGGEDASDIWYTFTAPETRDYDFFLTQNSTSANLLALFTGCGTGEIACGLNQASAHLDAGQMVYLRVGTNPDVADEFNVNVGPLPPSVAPPNDTFANATPITEVPQTIAGTTVGATGDALNWGPTCGPFVNAAVWYSFTAPDDGTYVFDTNGSAMDDTVLAVFDECSSGNGLPPALLGCDDDSGVGRHSRIDGIMKAGQSVCIAVAGRYLSEHGAFTLNVSRLPKHPVNDECAGAVVLPFPGKIEADNYASRSEQPATACPSGDLALWYSFTAPADGVYKLDVKDSVETSPDIAVYSSCGGDVLVCSGDPKPAVSLEMKADQTVFVRISTNVFVRAPMVLRVGPAGMPASSGTGGAGGGSSSSTASGSTSSSGGDGGGGGSPEEPRDGCGCRVGAAADGRAPIAGLLLALLLGIRLSTNDRRRTVSGTGRSPR
jgi:MYXO-CTERM domain-containing protein